MKVDHKTQDHQMGNNKFKIRKFDPETGSYWAFRLFGDLISTGAVSLKGTANESALAARIGSFCKMERHEFREFQSDCLRHVGVYLQGQGIVPVRDEAGNFVVDINGVDALELTTRAFMFTMQDFLSRGASVMRTTMPKAQNTSDATSSTPPLNTDIGDNANCGTEPTQPPIG